MPIKNKIFEELVKNYNSDTQSSQYQGFCLTIEATDSPVNPLDYISSKIFIFHNMDNFQPLGHENDYSSFQDMKANLSKDYDIFARHNIFISQPSQSHLSFTSSKGEIDGDADGVIFITKKDAQDLTNTDTYLEQTLELYNQYVNGEVYTIKIDYHGKSLGFANGIYEWIKQDNLAKLLEEYSDSFEIPEELK